jgi:hypothetical protein
MHSITIALEWTGAVLGLFGAALLASNQARAAPYGWLAFLAANVAMIAFALSVGANGLLAQQLGFMVTSLVGLRVCSDHGKGGAETASPMCESPGRLSGALARSAERLGEP